MNLCLNCNKPVKNKFCNVHCQNEYKRKAAEIEYYKNPNRCLNCDKNLDYDKRNNKFCSKSCSVSFNNKKRIISQEQKEKISSSLKHKNKKKLFICCVCGKSYYLENHINTRKVCSKECSEYLRKNRKNFLSEVSIDKLQKAGLKSANIQKETRRSKNEIYFYNLCKDYFKNVEHNENIFNGWDADIIIHDINYAVLWNGIWHYKQIKKNTSLKQIQNRDNIKIKEIQNCNYTPYIICDMGKYNKQFVENEFNKFIETITLWGGEEVTHEAHISE